MATQLGSIRYYDMWDNFDPNEYFLPLINGIDTLQNQSLDELGIDIELHSVFKKKERSLLGRVKEKAIRAIGSASGRIEAPRPAFRLWYTAENKRPATGRFHAMLSFDKTDPGRDNFRVPHWWLLFPELVGGPPMGQDIRRLGVQISLDEALNGRKISEGPREKFACGFFGRMWFPRRDIVNALGEVGQVDVFGPGSGKPVNTKIEVATHYRYMLCPENDLYPGYITEKAVEAWATGAIPIYWGNDAYSDLNPDAIINLATLDGVDDLVDKVRELEQNPDKAAVMSSLPILTKAPDISGLRHFVDTRLQAFLERL